MFKRKKLLIVAAVLVMMLLMTVTAYAQTSNTCTLHATANEAKTSGLTTRVTHYSGYNSSSSTDSMYVKLEVNAGGKWVKIDSRILALGDYARSSSLNVSALETFRTRIHTQDGNGGVEGVGCVFDW